MVRKDPARETDGEVRSWQAAEELISVQGDGLPRRSEHQAVHYCLQTNSASAAEGLPSAQFGRFSAVPLFVPLDDRTGRT